MPAMWWLLVKLKHKKTREIRGNNINSNVTALPTQLSRWSPHSSEEASNQFRVRKKKVHMNSIRNIQFSAHRILRAIVVREEATFTLALIRLISFHRQVLVKRAKIVCNFAIFDRKKSERKTEIWAEDGGWPIKSMMIVHVCDESSFPPSNRAAAAMCSCWPSDLRWR